MKTLRAVLLLRCPRCLRGPVYRRPLRTNQRCPACGLVFEREPGYFTGAMYASYTIGIFGTLPIWLTLLLAGASLAVLLIVEVALVLLIMPIAFHYSRVLWLHWDYHFNPKTFAGD